MTTLKTFIETGALGPLTLGTTLQRTTDLLGHTDRRSRKTNPLQLKYGACELVFIQKSNTPHRLREITISFHQDTEALPEAIKFNDFPITPTPSDKDFIEYIKKINCITVSTTELEEGAKSLRFASGVNAIIANHELKSIRFAEKEVKHAKPVTDLTEREPSDREITEMLKEAQKAIAAGATRAGLLISWAALEAALRRRSHFLGKDSRLGQQVVVLIHELLASGEFSPSEHKTIEHLRQIRSEIAHGLSIKNAPLDYFEAISHLVYRLLSQTPSNRLET